LPEEIKLSEREEEILKLVATGMTNREIAQELTISPNTVKVHLSNIFEKLGVASRTEATLYGIEHGMVAVPGNGNAEETAPFIKENPLRKYLWLWISIFVVVTGLLVFLGVRLSRQRQTSMALAELEDRWQQLAPLPQSREGMAATAYDGQVFTIAGQGLEGTSGSVFRYLPGDDRWERLRDKPIPVRDVKAVLIGERIYVPGGKLDDSRLTNILEIYDPRTDTWEKGSSLPLFVSDYALANFEGRLYLFGGWDGERALSSVYIYNPEADTWTQGTGMTTARQGAGAVALADKIVVIGGRNMDGALKDSWAYFPSRDRANDHPWEPFEDLPEPRYDFGIASTFDSIFIIGGILENEDTKASSGLVIDETGWVDLPTIQPYLGHSIEMVSLGGQLVIIDSIISPDTTQVWQYQAFYYSIYIPLVQ
jgi:DNA-binding CsgD family transcriptional regulator